MKYTDLWEGLIVVSNKDSSKFFLIDDVEVDNIEGRFNKEEKFNNTKIPTNSFLKNYSIPTDGNKAYDDWVKQVDAKILTKHRDKYLHEMLFLIYQSNKNDDIGYYELFANNDSEIPPKISVDLLFYEKEERIFFKKIENIKVPYSDLYCNREFYPMHYLSFLILEKLSKHYNPRRIKIKELENDYIEELPNISSFKKIKDKYKEFIYLIIKELEFDNLSISDIIESKGKIL